MRKEALHVEAADVSRSSPGRETHDHPVTTESQSYFFCAAFLAFQNDFILADSFALFAALILRLDFFTGFPDDFFSFIVAQRAFAAAEILALPAALIFRRLRGAGAPLVPNNRVSSFSNDWILSLMSAARRN